MADTPEFKSELPTEEELEEGRKSSVFLGVIIGAGVVLAGIVAYMLFGKYLQF